MKKTRKVTVHLNEEEIKEAIVSYLGEKGMKANVENVSIYPDHCFIDGIFTIRDEARCMVEDVEECVE